jgi:hypothetical protein
MPAVAHVATTTHSKGVLGMPTSFIASLLKPHSIVVRCLPVQAHLLPRVGILVTAFAKPHFPQVVVPRIEAICDRLRSK